MSTEFATKQLIKAKALLAYAEQQAPHWTSDYGFDAYLMEPRVVGPRILVPDTYCSPTWNSYVVYPQPE